MERQTLEWRKKKAQELRGTERREARHVAMQLQDTGPDTWTLTGFASVTDVDYEVGFYIERIAPGAFKRTLNEGSDVQLLVNHTGMPLARTTSGTMRLREVLTPDASGKRGLWVEADLDKHDPDAQALAGKMLRGDIDQMSMSFQITSQTWSDDYTRRLITCLNLHRGDVSVVNQAANPAALATVRAHAAGEPLPDSTRRARQQLFVLSAGRTAAPATDNSDRIARARRDLADLRRGAA